MASNVKVPLSKKCLLDSGSNIHIAVHKDQFVDFRIISGKVSGIAEAPLDVEGIGTVKLVYPSTGYEITLNEVHYVPDGTQNILSVKKASKFGFQFSEHKVHFIPYGFDSKLQIGSTEGSLYFSDYVPSVAQTFAVKSVNVELMHSKLGHPSPATLKLLGYSGGPSVGKCVSCAAGKMTKVYPKLSTTPPASAPLQLIHADVCGSFPVKGTNDEKFFLTIVDDYSRWTHVIPIQKKSDTVQLIKSFIQTAENLFASKRFKAAILRTDNGGEFCNDEMDAYCAEKGITHQMTVSYNSSQNGVVIFGLKLLKLLNI